MLRSHSRCSKRSASSISKPMTHIVACTNCMHTLDNQPPCMHGTAWANGGPYLRTAARCAWADVPIVLKCAAWRPHARVPRSNAQTCRGWLCRAHNDVPGRICRSGPKWASGTASNGSQRQGPVHECFMRCVAGDQRLLPPPITPTVGPRASRPAHTLPAPPALPCPPPLPGPHVAIPPPPSPA